MSLLNKTIPGSGSIVALFAAVILISVFFWHFWVCVGIPYWLERDLEVAKGRWAGIVAA